MKIKLLALLLFPAVCWGQISISGPSSGGPLTDPVFNGTATGSAVSTVGGISKLLKTGTNGFLYTGTANNAGAGQVAGVGNIIIPDLQGIGWTDQSGNVTANIFHNEAHSGGGELLYAADRHCWYWNDEMQIGDAGSARVGKRSIYLRALSATVGDTLRETPAIQFRSNTWTGGVSTADNFAVQGVPLDATGTNSVIRFTPNSTVSGTGTVSGTSVLDITNYGLRIPSGRTISISGTGGLVTPSISGTTGGVGVNFNGSTTQIVSGSASVFEVSSGLATSLATLRAQIGSAALTLGADSNLTTVTSSVNKVGRLNAYRYDSAFAVWTVLHPTGNSGANTINIGGGTSVQAPATQVSIWSGTSATTSGTGVETLRSAPTALTAFVPLTATNVTLSGTLTLSGTSAPPSDTVTPARWADVTVSGTIYKLPLYQ